MEATTRQAIRKQMRARRRALTPRQQRQAARALSHRLASHPLFIRSRHIALYLPNDGEIDPAPLLKLAQQRGKQCYLPVLQPHRHNQLWFVRYHSRTPMVKNMFGIWEPRIRAYGDQRWNRRPAWALDLVLMPLVAFDPQGGRLGMGGGFYDRTFAFMRQDHRPAPTLLGLAHELQKMEQLPLESWDIPLHGVATDAAIYWHTPQRRPE